MAIKVGDVVKADRFADQEMTVDSLGKSNCVCIWFTPDNKLHKAAFSLDELQISES